VRIVLLALSREGRLDRSFATAALAFGDRRPQNLLLQEIRVNFRIICPGGKLKWLKGRLLDDDSRVRRPPPLRVAALNRPQGRGFREVTNTV